MSLATLRDLYLRHLQDLYSAERQCLRMLPRMVEAAESEALKDALEGHFAVTLEQLERLRRIFAGLDREPGRERCLGMVGLLAEGEEVIEEDAAGPVRDEALIAAAQRVERYEIVGYDTVRSLAERLGEDAAADLLSASLREEADADERLGALAAELAPGAEQAA